MDPKLVSILTVFIIGLVSFLIGWLLTSSGDKDKVKKLKAENESLKADSKKAIEGVELRKKKVKEMRAELDTVSRERNEAKQKNAKLVDENRRLENVSHSPSGKLYKQEYESLYEQYVDEMEKRRNLEREKLNWMSSGSKKGNTANLGNVSSGVKTKVDSELNGKLNSIFTRVGFGNALKRDDLTKITGVGPDVQDKLNKAGIFNFKQIASLLPADLETIDNAIQHFPGRALKDDWIGQAKKLAR